MSCAAADKEQVQSLVLFKYTKEDYINTSTHTNFLRKVSIQSYPISAYVLNNWTKCKSL